MIERLYLKESLGFKEVELEFKNGLIVLTGPSGAGKSVLIDSILALFGLKNVNAKLSEISLNTDIDLDEFGIEKDEIIVIKSIKKDKIRYFINSQTVSKKRLKDIFKDFISYLSQKDNDIFKSSNIVKVIDDISSRNSKDFLDIYKDFKEKYAKFQKLKEKYEKILDEEKSINDLKEFAKFEIEKIEKISPKTGEYEELLKIKKDLSKREKIQEAIKTAENIFDYENLVVEALDKIGKDYSFFDEAMNELRTIFEDEKSRLAELDEIDIEEVLNRIEELSELKRRYGSIEEAIEYKNRKIKELEYYENISFEKENLEKELEYLEKDIKELAENLSSVRVKSSKLLENDLNELVKGLKLSDIKLVHKKKDLDFSGIDQFDLKLKNVSFDKISSGEFNRLRLAFLASWAKYKDSSNHVLILDEIDANVSGEESMSVAKILKELSKKYQIFAISHQAQLSSVADQHFLVYKKDNQSYVKELSRDERIKEIARIISGEKITKEAEEFAKKMVLGN